jgi:hypothetical protein
MQGDSTLHNRGGLSPRGLEIVIGHSFEAYALDTSLVRRVRPGVFLVNGRVNAGTDLSRVQRLEGRSLLA